MDKHHCSRILIFFHNLNTIQDIVQTYINSAHKNLMYKKNLIKLDILIQQMHRLNAIKFIKSDAH